MAPFSQEFYSKGHCHRLSTLQIIQLESAVKTLISIIAIVALAGCAAPPPVRIASSILGRTVLKDAKQEYQKNHPSPTPSPTPSQQ
jgi:hypothetical protein